MNETPFHLNGKTILVTGGSSGIGREVAHSISNMGGKVFITGRNDDRLKESEVYCSGTGIKCDLTDAHDRSDLLERITNIDGVVHCAGTVNPFPIRFINQEKIEETMNINYNSILLLMAELFSKKKLNRGASIVYMSSISGQHPHKGGVLYASSKAAIEALSKVTALEYYSIGIRSNCISPAMVKTKMFDEAAKDMSVQSMEEHVQKYPLGVGYPEDVANATVFLLSDAARWISGINLTLDGGFLLEGGS